MQTPKSPPHFYVRSCSFATLATGEQANSLMGLRDKVATVDELCIYHHFWGGRMRPQFSHPQYHNDFANWVQYALHDHILAEKLSIIDPTEFDSLETLRLEVLETLERRLDEYEIIHWTTKENCFHFMRSITMVFETNVIVKSPEELPKAIELIPPSSVFYHFIDARARTEEHTDDFSVWLKDYGNKYEGLTEKLQAIDPYFLSLSELKHELLQVVNSYFDAGRG